MTDNDDLTITFVYLIAPFVGGEFQGPCKIGIAEDIPRRVQQLQTASPYRLGVYYALRFPWRSVAEHVEKLLHTYHKTERLEGEWFDLPPDELRVTMNAMVLACRAEIGKNMDPEDASFIFDYALPENGELSDYVFKGRRMVKITPTPPQGREG